MTILIHDIYIDDDTHSINGGGEEPIVKYKKLSGDYVVKAFIIKHTTDENHLIEWIRNIECINQIFIHRAASILPTLKDHKDGETWRFISEELINQESGSYWVSLFSGQSLNQCPKSDKYRYERIFILSRTNVESYFEEGWSDDEPTDKEQRIERIENKKQLDCLYDCLQLDNFFNWLVSLQIQLLPLWLKKEDSTNILNDILRYCIIDKGNKMAIGHAIDSLRAYDEYIDKEAAPCIYNFIGQLAKLLDSGNADANFLKQYKKFCLNIKSEWEEISDN